MNAFSLNIVLHVEHKAMGAIGWEYKVSPSVFSSSLTDYNINRWNANSRLYMSEYWSS